MCVTFVLLYTFLVLNFLELKRLLKEKIFFFPKNSTNEVRINKQRTSTGSVIKKIKKKYRPKIRRNLGCALTYGMPQNF